MAPPNKPFEAASAKAYAGAQGIKRFFAVIQPKKKAGRPPKKRKKNGVIAANTSANATRDSPSNGEHHANFLSDGERDGERTNFPSNGERDGECANFPSKGERDGEHANFPSNGERDGERANFPSDGERADNTEEDTHHMGERRAQLFACKGHSRLAQ